MEASDNAYVLIRRYEGCRLNAYPDPATGGDPVTIGYGATGPGIKLGVTWTQQQAEDRLRSDVQSRAQQLTVLLAGVKTTQAQFDAMLVFMFNLGLRNLRDSTLLKMHKAANYDGAAQQFARWNKANGKVMNGLTTRRNAESRLYQGLGV